MKSQRFHIGQRVAKPSRTSSGLRLLAAVSIAALLLVVGAGPVACDGARSGTTGRRIALDVTLAASPASHHFINARGWEVSITKALVATGALYFYDGDTLFADARAGGAPTVRRRAARSGAAAGSGAPRAPRPRAGIVRAPSHGDATRRDPGGAFWARATWSFVQRAFAHPGHYVPGEARGELLTPSSADLLTGGVLGTGDGVSGVARSATFSFASPAAGPAAALLESHVIVLEGSATKDGSVRLFRAEIGPDDVRDEQGNMNVEGCPFVEADMQGDGTIAIEVELPLWLDQVVFDELPPSPDGRPVVLGDGLARRQLVRGVKGGLAYVFSYSER